MTTYKVDRYGAANSYYGDPDASGALLFSAAPFVATCTFPNFVQLRWRLPVGQWTQLRLVRSTNGVPTYERDGAILFDRAVGPASTTPDTTFTFWADYGFNNPLTSGSDHNGDPSNPLITGDRWYDYALFVYGIVSGVGVLPVVWDWVPVADTDVLVVNDHANGAKMAGLLPSVYTTNPRWAGEGQSDIDSDGYRFLSIFGFQADVVRAVYDSLLHIHDPKLVPTRLLPLMCAELGVPYEPEMGLGNTRALLTSACHIHKTKGTRVGIEDFTTALTGWGCDIIPGLNLMLDYNDSSAEEATGNWGVRTNCTLARVTVAPFTNGSNLANGAFSLTSLAAGLAEVHCGDTITHGTLRSGVPVSEGLTYTLSMYVRAPVTPLVNAVGIAWYDRDGVFLSNSIGADVTTITTDWTRTSVTAAAPAHAQFGAVLLRVTATDVSQVAYWDGVQLEVAATASTFQEARQLQLVLAADRINQCLNPSFEVDTTNWTIAATTSAAAASSVARLVTDHAIMASGTSSASVATAGVSAFEGITTTSASLLQNQNYVVSVYVKPLTGRPVVLRAVNSDDTILVSDPALVGDGWQRLAVTLATGVLAPSAQFSVTTDNTVGASTFLVDGVLVERGVTLLDYFDGDLPGASTTDYFWGGAANESVSYQYRDYVTRANRLNELLPDYTWPGMTWNFVIGSSAINSGYGSGAYGAGAYGASGSGGGGGGVIEDFDGGSYDGGVYA